MFMQKRILVDTNILVDFAEGRGYARKFFEIVSEKCYEIYVLKDCCFEASRVTKKFDRIQLLMAELNKQDLYHLVGLTEEEKEYSRTLIGSCIEVLGYDLSPVDRRIITVAKFRKLAILSKDNDLVKIAKKEKIKII